MKRKEPFMDRQKLETVLQAENILIDEPMSRHTTFRTGGNADYFVTPESAEELEGVIRLCREEGCAYYLMGNGSNLLVGDHGYRGVIIQIYRNMNAVEVEGNEVRVQAGALLSSLAAKAVENSLAGFEFASGIPGTFGGAVAMNAGAYGGEMKDIIKSVRVLTPEGRILTMDKEELELGYRTSVVAKKGYIVLDGVIELQPGDRETIRGRMDELKQQRITKQPLEYPSAGSTFKRPEGYFAGKLIQDAGLRGFQVGGAQVSEKHCGFVINKDHATSADIVELMRQVQQKVKETSGVILEAEVKRIGEF
jgi:UDP-N-acetylmuramate dehydrogenase